MCLEMIFFNLQYTSRIGGVTELDIKSMSLNTIISCLPKILVNVQSLQLQMLLIGLEVPIIDR